MKAAKHSAVLKNGRSKKSPSRFEDMWAKVSVELISSSSWRSLTINAKDVYLIMLVKHSHAGFFKKFDSQKRPTFSFTYKDAMTLLQMSSSTFKKSLGALKSRGFVEVSRHGGVLDGRGRATLFCLRGDWKTWMPPIKATNKMGTARAARKSRSNKFPT